MSIAANDANDMYNILLLVSITRIFYCNSTRYEILYARDTLEDINLFILLLINTN